MAAPAAPQRASNPFVQIVDMIPITTEQFTMALTAVATVGVVWTNWHRADGWKGLVKQASISEQVVDTEWLVFCGTE